YRHCKELHRYQLAASAAEKPATPHWLSLHIAPRLLIPAAVHHSSPATAPDDTKVVLPRISLRRLWRHTSRRTFPRSLLQVTALHIEPDNSNTVTSRDNIWSPRSMAGR